MQHLKFFFASQGFFFEVFEKGIHQENFFVNVAHDVQRNILKIFVQIEIRDYQFVVKILIEFFFQENFESLLFISL